MEASLGPFPAEHLRALEVVPRDRFVRADDVAHAEVDAPLPLDDTGAATISAPHAYLLSYRLLDLRAGDRLLELGSGSGYGAALGAQIVGPHGRVTTIEIDAALAARAKDLLSPLANVHALHGDATHASAFFAECNKVVAAFAVKELPSEWTAALQPGAVLVAPVGAATQHLLRVERTRDGRLDVTRHGAVRYVPNRSK
ncbi:MAG TPA: methyltransferase domain-containing protein [Polyangiaceae bacterium]